MLSYFEVNYRYRQDIAMIFAVCKIKEEDENFSIMEPSATAGYCVFS